MFYKICKFEIHVTRNDVIIKSLPKTLENNGKMRTSVEPSKIYIVRKVLMRAIQTMQFLLNLSHCVKSYAHLCQIYQTTHQIWSCHVILTSNSEKFYFSPNTVLNFGKSYQTKSSRTKKLQAKNKLGVESSPSQCFYCST